MGMLVWCYVNAAMRENRAANFTANFFASYSPIDLVL